MHIVKLFEEFTYTGVQDHFGLGVKFTDKLQLEYQELKTNPDINWAIFDIDNDVFIANSDNYDQNFEGGSVPKAIAGACALHKNGGDFDSTHDMWKLQKLLVNSNNQMWSPIQQLAGGGEAVNNWSNQMGWGNMKPSSGSRLVSAKGMSLFWRDTLNRKYKGAQIIETLAYGCETGRNRMRKYLPTDIKVGHKTGTMVTAKTKFARNDSGWIITQDGRRIGITVLTHNFGSAGEEKIAIMTGGLYREFCLNNTNPSAPSMSTQIENWQPKSGVVFLPIVGKGKLSEESKSKFFFGKDNYPWIGINPNQLTNLNDLKYLILIPQNEKSFENILDKINDGTIDFIRGNTIIILNWSASVDNNATKDDLETAKKFLKINKSVPKIENSLEQKVLNMLR
jgi:hypothetical protein